MKKRSDRQRSAEAVQNAQGIAKLIAQKKKQRSRLKNLTSDILKKVGTYHATSRNLNEKPLQLHSSFVSEDNSDQVHREKIVELVYIPG